MSRLKEKGILPGLHNEEKPGKNFLLENIKRLREIQRETQKKLASQNQSNPNYFHSRKVPDLKIRSYQKRNKSELDLADDSDVPSLKSRLSTPVTAMASPKPVKNQKMQTVAAEKVPRGKVMQPRTAAPPPPAPAPKKVEKKPSKMVRAASLPSVPSFNQESDLESNTPDQTEETRSSKRHQEIVEKLISGEKKDFVAYNTYRTYREKVKPKKPDPIKPPPSYRIGELPRYMQVNKSGELPTNHPPGEYGGGDVKASIPGYIMLSERERKDHLDEFKRAYSDLLGKLRNVPLSSDSYSNRQRKMHLEKELQKLEDLMKMFSRGRLYIKVS